MNKAVNARLVSRMRLNSNSRSMKNVKKKESVKVDSCSKKLRKRGIREKNKKNGKKRSWTRQVKRTEMSTKRQRKSGLISKTDLKTPSSKQPKKMTSNVSGEKWPKKRRLSKRKSKIRLRKTLNS